jgi:hypothetical protein
MFNKYDQKSMVAVENHATSVRSVTTPSTSKDRSASMFERAEDEVEIDETTFIDSVKMACLLCKRKFDSMDILHKHMAMSDLHKVLCAFFLNLHIMKSSFNCFI